MTCTLDAFAHTTSFPLRRSLPSRTCIHWSSRATATTARETPAPATWWCSTSATTLCVRQARWARPAQWTRSARASSATPTRRTRWCHRLIRVRPVQSWVCTMAHIESRRPRRSWRHHSTDCHARHRSWWNRSISPVRRCSRTTPRSHWATAVEEEAAGLAAAAHIIAQGSTPRTVDTFHQMTRVRSLLVATSTWSAAAAASKDPSCSPRAISTSASWRTVAAASVIYLWTIVALPAWAEAQGCRRQAAAVGAVQQVEQPRRQRRYAAWPWRQVARPSSTAMVAFNPIRCTVWRTAASWRPVEMCLPRQRYSRPRRAPCRGWAASRTLAHLVRRHRQPAPRARCVRFSTRYGNCRRASATSSCCSAEVPSRDCSTHSRRPWRGHPHCNSSSTSICRISPRPQQHPHPHQQRHRQWPQEQRRQWPVRAKSFMPASRPTRHCTSQWPPWRRLQPPSVVFSRVPSAASSAAPASLWIAAVSLARVGSPARRPPRPAAGCPLTVWATTVLCSMRTTRMPSMRPHTANSLNNTAPAVAAALDLNF